MIDGKSVLSVTLARGGSKGIPKKNIVSFAGLPLLAHTIIEAKRSQYIDDYIISTDDDAIGRCAQKYGAFVPFQRPEKLSSDTATSADALIHAVGWMEEYGKKRYDYILELMCTNPMKTVQDIDAVIDKLHRTAADSVVSVVRLEDHHPMRVKQIVDDRLIDFCVYEKPENRRQDLKPPAYIRNGAIYAIKRDVLFTTKARYGTENCRPYIMDARISVNIDSSVDLIVGEELIRQNSKIYSERRKND